MMTRNLYESLPHSKSLLSNEEEVLEWSEAIERRYLSAEPMLVRVCGINGGVEQEEADIKIGDEFFLREVSLQHMRLLLEEDHEDPEKINVPKIVMPVKAGGRFRACPHFSGTHIFDSVQEMMDVYPFISDLIFSQQGFSIEGIDIDQWDILQIVRMVQASSANQLEVRIVKRNRHVLLPASLQVKFLQWNDNWQIQDEAALNKIKPRVYSLLELSEIWSSKLHPMIVKIFDEQDCAQPNCSHQQHQPSKKQLSKIFPKFKKDKKVNDDSASFKEDEDFWMIPEDWRQRRLVLEPVHMVQVTNPNTNVKSNLTGDLGMKVIQVVKTDEHSGDHGSVFDVHSSAHSVQDSPRRQQTSDSSSPLHQLNIMSLRSNRERSDAIVAVVTSSLNSGSRQPGSLAFGTWIALHRTRQVRKMLLKSPDLQYFLVSAHYAGMFRRLPLIFDSAEDVPLKSEIAYVTGCTAYPVNKQHDSCREGEFVWFKYHSEVVTNNITQKVVHCEVADSIDGERRSAVYPINLRGQFERFDDTPTEVSTRDLFRKELPVCVQVEKQDPSIGFDPLVKKKSFHVIKIISELTVIVETLKKGEDGLKGTGTLLEIPVKRCSLFLRKAPLKSADRHRGIDPFPMRKDFKGLLKLPCVEMLAEIDVNELQDALRSASTYPMLPMHFDKGTDTDNSSSQRSSLESNNSPAKAKAPTVIHPVRKFHPLSRKSKSADNIADVNGEHLDRSSQVKLHRHSSDEISTHSQSDVPSPAVETNTSFLTVDSASMRKNPKEAEPSSSFTDSGPRRTHLKEIEPSISLDNFLRRSPSKDTDSSFPTVDSVLRSPLKEQEPTSSSMYALPRRSSLKESASSSGDRMLDGVHPEDSEVAHFNMNHVPKPALRPKPRTKARSVLELAQNFNDISQEHADNLPATGSPRLQNGFTADRCMTKKKLPDNYSQKHPQPTFKNIRKSSISDHNDNEVDDKEQVDLTGETTASAPAIPPRPPFLDFQ